MNKFNIFLGFEEITMSRHNLIETAPFAWLMETGGSGIRYLILKDLYDLPESDVKLQAAMEVAHKAGPISDLLANMDPSGYWVNPGTGYNPKYRSTVWAVILLAQLGARTSQDKRIGRACTYLLENAFSPGGQFSISGPPSGTVDCLQGNLCWALLELGCQDDRLEKAFEWMARSVTGEGISPNTERDAPVRYYAGKCGPGFVCGANNKLPCAWGAVKVMQAFSRLPVEKRSALVERAIRQGIEFFFSVDPASAAYPTGYNDKPSGNWWKFGFPVFYVTDLIQLVEAAAGLGYGKDARLANAISLILGKQDGQGRWALEYSYSGKTWLDFGDQKQPNPWVTLRALRALKLVELAISQ
jgi:hypothetical protein